MNLNLPKRAWVWFGRLYNSDGLRKVLVGLAILIVLVSLPTIVFQQYQNNKSQNNHHAATVKTQAQLATALEQVKQSAAAIKYLLGVVSYEGGVIINAQEAGHATLAVMQSLQMEVSQELPAATAALKAGQAQINAYLGYLTCLTVNTSNQAVCGSPPPLPAT